MARSGLPSPLKSAFTPQPAPPATFVEAFTFTQQHGNMFAVGDDIRLAVVP